MKNILPITTLLIFCLTLPACRSYHIKTETLRTSFYRNDLQRTGSELASLQKKKDKNADLLKLEESVFRLCRGEFRQSEKLLREVRDTFDARDNQKFKSSAEAAMSMLTDDLATSYKGEDHEKVLIRVMLAVSSLMTDGQDAVPYAHQINLKQEEIIARGGEQTQGSGENPKQNYKMLAVGPYITGLMWEATAAGQHEAARAYEKVCQWAPYFSTGKADLRRAQTSMHSQKGNGAVYVITFLGKGPRKVQTSADVTQAALFIADRIVSMTSKHSVPPTIAPVPIPEIVETPCRFLYVDVFANGNRATRVSTETITDINHIAREQFEANRNWIIARAAARRIMKKAAIYGAKELTGTDSWAGEVLWDVAGVIWEATEEADTRCWSLLPGKIQVARLELPAGDHEITLEPMSGASSYGTGSYRKSVRVSDGRNTFVLAYIADEGLIGDVQVSE